MHHPQTIKLVRSAWSTWASRPSAWPTRCSSPWPGSRRPARRPRGQPPAQGAGDPLHQQEDARRPAQEDGARAAGHRGQGLRAHHPQPESATTAETEAVFYFPAAASERLFSQVGLATQAMLWHAGVQTVLPPGYLCCGYPQRGSGPVRQGREDHHRQPGAVPPRGQHAELPGHQDRGGQLRHLLRPAAGLPVRQDLPGCRIIDIHEYLLEKGITLQGRAQGATCTTTPATAR
jgi:hypothetical protein